MLTQIQKELRKVADKDKAKILARFFKTGKGEYGEGDKFLGVVVPEQRRIAKEYLRDENVVRSRFSSEPEMRLRTMFADLQNLLRSEYHEDRLTALLVLVELYRLTQKNDPTSPRLRRVNSRKIFLFYIKNLARTCPVRAKRFYGVNNWDLVDLSAPNIVGDYLFTLSEVEGLNNFSKIQIKTFLLKLAKSKNLWSRRVAVLATFPFIKNKKFEEILELTKFLLFEQKENHDLMHKALGWALREVGKRELGVLRNFLDHYAGVLPRTTLRYSIERLPQKERLEYLARPKIA